MAYLVAANFRPGANVWYTHGIELETSEVTDSELTALITAMSDRLNLLTDDYFEPEPTAGTLTIKLNGNGGTLVRVPKRIRTLTAINLRGTDGALTLQDATNYRYLASLEGGVRQEHDTDIIEVIPGRLLTNNYGWWPAGPQTVEITGTFSWLTTPDEIKRAVALMVWDKVKSKHDDLRRATRITSADAVYDLTEVPPEVQDIINRFGRQRIPAV